MSSVTAVSIPLLIPCENTMGEDTRFDQRREKHIGSARARLLGRIEESLELPMVILGFIWLLLLVVELVWGLAPILQALGTLIWIIFVLDFAFRFSLAPRKRSYLLKNWLTIIALIVPAFRVLRVARAVRLLRAARAARGLRLVRIITSVNRGVRVLGAAMGRHGFGYVLVATTMVIFAGAAGIYAFESGEGKIEGYGTALWWTAMIITTMGSDYWPQTPEGRTLCLLLAIYAFTVFGYVTATLATALIGQDSSKKEHDGQTAIRQELREIRERLESLSEKRKS